MRRLTTIALSFAVMCAFLMPAVAVAAEPSDEMRQEAATRLETYKNRLNLTPAQVEQIRPLLQEEVQKVKVIHQKYEGDTSPAAKKQFADEVEPVRNDFNQRLEKILTPDQMKEWEKIKSERKEELKKMKSST